MTSGRSKQASTRKTSRGFRRREEEEDQRDGMNPDAGLSVERRRGEVIRCLFVVRLLVTVGRHDSREGDGGRIITNQEPRQLTGITFKAIQGGKEQQRVVLPCEVNWRPKKREVVIYAPCAADLAYQATPDTDRQPSLPIPSRKPFCQIFIVKHCQKHLHLGEQA